ncbi:MAG TPA: methylenetetrahydrofolate reductase C-terminal domain-containing protein, partial [Anaerolineales bacterium]|nr:methylenetetrahydrofolate reductase C-terminal domain-containing protein [Anaerolineales bacterium]
MPGLTPGRRWQPAYTPFQKENFGDKALQVLEYSVKGPLFGCRMCGNCLLQETALICPMECPKGLRNGPCGGSTSEYCYVDKTRPCVWYKIYERSFKYGREELLLEVLPPLDWEKVGTDSWRDVFRQIAKLGVRKTISALLSRSAKTRQNTWDGVFRPVRQPAWWNGDSKYH